MKPFELKEARRALGLTLAQMGRLLGYTGTHGAQQVRKMESGNRAIREAQALLVRAYLDGYRPQDWPKKENTNA